MLDLFKGTYSYGWSYGGATVNVGADNNLYASEIKAKALADVYNSDSSEAGSNANDDEDKYNIYSLSFSTSVFCSSSFIKHLFISSRNICH